MGGRARASAPVDREEDGRAAARARGSHVEALAHSTDSGDQDVAGAPVVEMTAAHVRIGDRTFSRWLLAPDATMPEWLRAAVATHDRAVRRGYCEDCAARWWVTGTHLDVAHEPSCPAHAERRLAGVVDWLRATFTPEQLASLRERAGQIG